MFLPNSVHVAHPGGLGDNNIKAWRPIINPVQKRQIILHPWQLRDTGLGLFNHS